MKITSLLVALSLLPFCATAQLNEAAANRKYYVGASISNISYMMVNEQPRVSGSFSPVAFINAGYYLNKRTVLQLGIGYGQSEYDLGSIYYKSADSTIYYEGYRKTRGFGIPLTVRFTPFNPAKRLQLYATASLIPVFGTVKLNRTQELYGVKETIYDTDASVFNLLGTAGLMLHYRINDRLDAYIEGNLVYKNFTRFDNYANSRPKSLGVGMNYKLK